MAHRALAPNAQAAAFNIMKIWRIMPWWWRGLLMSVVLILVIIAFSFFWITAWLSPRCRYYVYLEHGLVCGSPHPVVTGAPAFPFGSFELYQSGIYEPWRLLPVVSFDDPRGASFKFPLHIVVGVTMVILIYTGIRFARAADRAARGLCRVCQYDLRGNVSGVCPECGRECM